ncbi:unnamed protein product, partial [Didymodactylos carnosus]
MPTHVIAVGDTFWQLALRYACPLEDLLAANPKVKPEFLVPGQIIEIPSSSIKPEWQREEIEQAHSRYTDVPREPTDKLLTPIKGYKDVPVLPLEKAIQPIQHLFHNLSDYVHTAKKNCRSPKDQLSQDESAAIHLYTMEFSVGPSFYQLLNETLRSEHRDSLKPWFHYLKLFLTALQKLPTHPRTTVWRGVKDVNLSKDYKTGAQFVWWSVSSCTTAVDVLQTEQFLGKTGTRTLFSVECDTAKSISNHSYYSQTEREMILMPGTFLEVVGRLNPAENLFIIQLKEIPSSTQLVLQPLALSPQFENMTTIKASITAYGWNDNFPPSAKNAFPKKAGHPTLYDESTVGDGSYSYPISFASNPKALPIGTRIYLPYLRKYFILDDYSEAATIKWNNEQKHHIVLWLGRQGAERVHECRLKLAREDTEIFVNPEEHLP